MPNCTWISSLLTRLTHYNEQLVKRGKILISKDVMNWDQEIAAMSRSKIGRPYLYQESFMRMTAYAMFYFRLPYLQMEC